MRYEIREYKIQDMRYKIWDTKNGIQDIRYEIWEYETKYTQY